MQQSFKIYILICFLLLLGLHESDAQQSPKPGKYTMQRRQAKMELSSPGDVSVKTYTKLEKNDLISRGKNSQHQPNKSGTMYRNPKKYLKKIHY